MNFETLQSMEWLETNGLGGYASSTVANCNSRKYHGLLVSKLPGLPDRHVLLSTLDESLVVDGEEDFFSCHRFPGVTHPMGHQFLQQFSREPLPAFTYRIRDIILKKQIMLLQGEDTLLIKYAFVRNPGEVRLRVHPMLAFRNFHHLTKANDFAQVAYRETKGHLVFAMYEGMPTLGVSASHPFNYHHAPDWYRNFLYDQETKRGFDATEDLLRPGILEFRVNGNDELVLSFALKPLTGRLDKAWGWAYEERLAREKVLPKEEPIRSLTRAADQFVVKNANGKKTIVAGYHWFQDWGRDAMIALPGLMSRRSSEDYLSVLSTFAEKERRGLIPNFISETTHEAAYNTVDASLWFIWAVQQYTAKTNDWSGAAKTAWRTIMNIFCWYSRGTDYGIRMRENGLIHAGDPGTQLTWMDAQVNGLPVTPRYGFAVEINALWYNALVFMREFAVKINEPSPIIKGLPDKVRDSFLSLFWDPQNKRLADVVNEHGADFSVRPNQIFSVSMPYIMLNGRQAGRVTETVKKELLTPFGLRTLSPSHRQYRAQYAGHTEARDAAYHNGTAWPWLLGAYGEALLKTSKNKKAAHEELNNLFLGFNNHLALHGLGTVAEIFDGSAPYAPEGCISQAWSVGELLRLYNLYKN